MKIMVRAINECVPEVQSKESAYEPTFSFHRVDRYHGSSNHNKSFSSRRYSAHLMEILIPDRLTVSKILIYPQVAISM